MVILGINAYHGDASACVVVDGKLIAAAEEERFRRIKHWAGFPTKSIEYCVKAAGINIEDIDHVAINRNPKAHLSKKIIYLLSHKPNLSFITSRLKNAAKVRTIQHLLAESFGIDPGKIRARIHNVEHHLSHLASSFFVSPYENAAVVSVDGFGDFVSTKWGVGKGNIMSEKAQIYFPHSLGLFYLAMTQFLGFNKYGDEYKVMGLAPYGELNEMDKMRKIVLLNPNGQFRLGLKYFAHHTNGITMTWEGGEPLIGTVYSPEMIRLLGSPRKPAEPISDYHKNLAASMQAMYEEAFFHILNHVQKTTKAETLCLSGGCAMNSVANGKIFEKSKFKNIYIQSAAGDAGGAIGAAFYVWNSILNKKRSFVMEHAYWGPEFKDTYISNLIEEKHKILQEQNCLIENIKGEAELCSRTAKHVSDGKVVGWFQGRMEWGPRALGNRSILGDPRRNDMKDILNLKIKKRESFRPFAPSIVREAVADWFETDYDVPFMLQVYQIKKEKQKLIPAVTHVNGSGRLQTVTMEQNPRYYHLIKEFGKITGVPIVLNTSFNENEPVVCTPDEAMDCFLRTKMDVLVLNNFMIKRI